MVIHFRVRFSWVVITMSTSTSVPTITGFCAPDRISVFRATRQLYCLASGLWYMKLMGYFFDTSIMAAGLEWFGTTSRSFGKIYFMSWSITALPSSIVTSMDSKIPNQIRVRRYLNWTCSIIKPFMVTGFWYPNLIKVLRWMYWECPF